MSTTFRFIDENNKSARPVWQGIMTVSLLEMVRHQNNRQDIPDPKVNEALDLIEQQPVFSTRQIATSSYYDSDKWHCIAGHEKFGFNQRTTDANNIALTLSDAQQSWAHIEQLQSLMDHLNAFIEKHEYTNPGLYQRLTVFRASKLNKKLNSDIITIENVEAVNEFAQNKAYALFVSYHNPHPTRKGTTIEGYINNQLLIGVLLKAKFFDSEQEAKTYIQKKGLLRSFSEIQIVGVDINMTATHTLMKGNGVRSTLTDGRLQEAIAHTQRQQIDKALQEASLEKLKERLNDLQDAKQDQKPAKKRM